MSKLLMIFTVFIRISYNLCSDWCFKIPSLSHHPIQSIHCHPQNCFTFFSYLQAVNPSISRSIVWLRVQTHIQRFIKGNPPGFDELKDFSLNATHPSILWLTTPAWYLHFLSGLYQLGNGGCKGVKGTSATWPILSSLWYISVRGMGSGGSCSDCSISFVNSSMSSSSHYFPSITIIFLSKLGQLFSM